MKSSYKFFIVFVFLPFIIFPQTKQPIKFATHWLPQAQFAGYYAAVHYKIYEKHGIEVNLVHAGPNVTSQTLLAQGKVDAASMFLSTALIERSKNVELINIGQLSQQCAQLFVVKKSSGISEPNDLNNKKIGIWKSGFDEIPAAFLLQYNLDVEIVPVASTITLFILGGVDVMTTMWYNEYHTILNSGINEEELTTFFFSDYGFDVPEDGIYCLKKSFDSDPELYHKFVSATIEGWQYAFNNRDLVLDLVIAEMNKANIPANRAHQNWMLDRMEDIFTEKEMIELMGKLKKDDFNKTVQVLIETNKITGAPTFSEFYLGR